MQMSPPPLVLLLFVCNLEAESIISYLLCIYRILYANATTQRIKIFPADNDDVAALFVVQHTHRETHTDIACRRHIFYLNHFVVLSRAAWELRHLPQCGIDCQINQEGEGKTRQG